MDELKNGANFGPKFGLQVDAACAEAAAADDLEEEELEQVQGLR
jgi:hypothetical protein